jgi:hypothetical protein
VLKLCFYVPEDYLEIVKEAVFKAGAGDYGLYTKCCFQTSGQGQFLPSPEANPFIGTQSSLEYVTEYRVEMLCPEDNAESVIKALQAAHPYETPAWDLTQLYRF